MDSCGQNKSYYSYYTSIYNIYYCCGRQPVTVDIRPALKLPPRLATPQSPSQQSVDLWSRVYSLLMTYTLSHVAKLVLQEYRNIYKLSA